jgi:hypothetical protein
MIPEAALKMLEEELQGLRFGGVTLEVTVHDGRLKWRIIKIISMAENKSSGETKAG